MKKGKRKRVLKSKMTLKMETGQKGKIHKKKKLLHLQEERVELRGHRVG